MFKEKDEFSLIRIREGMKSMERDTKHTRPKEEDSSIITHSSYSRQERSSITFWMLDLDDENFFLLEEQLAKLGRGLDAVKTNTTIRIKVRGAKGQEEKRGEKKRVIERVKKEDERRNPMKKEEEEGITRLHVETKEIKGFSKSSCGHSQVPHSPFAGGGDVETFLDLEMKVDQVLDCVNYDD
ncbi:hypothetical protein CR513_20694, partial [Mucuna pruriens]